MNKDNTRGNSKVSRQPHYSNPMFSEEQFLLIQQKAKVAQKWIAQKIISQIWDSATWIGTYDQFVSWLEIKGLDREFLVSTLSDRYIEDYLSENLFYCTVFVSSGGEHLFEIRCEFSIAEKGLHEQKV